MEFLISNWYVGIAIIAVLFILVVAVYVFIKTPSTKQIEKVKQWMLYAILTAEKELGSKTGRLKLSLVYGSFVSKFKWLSMIMSFEMFSQLVDECLEEMRKMLETNKAVARIVTGEVKQEGDK